MEVSIYQSCFELIHEYIYGGVTLTSDMNLVCTLVATAACLFCFSLPFVIVYIFIKAIASTF